MKKVGFIGGFDKTDLIIYIAKILTKLGNKVMIIDTTVSQKSKYMVPALNPTISYITEFEEIDIAVGFKNFNEIAEYSGKTTGQLEYDYTLIDIDNYDSALNFELQNSAINFFVTSFDIYSIRKGLEALEGLQTPLEMIKVIFSKEIRKEDDEYLNYLSLGYKVVWRDDKIFFPYEMGDQTVIIDNQKVAKVRFGNLSTMYKNGMQYIVEKIEPETQPGKIKKIIKEI